MKLYQSSLSPSGRRVAIFMAEKGVSVEIQEVDLKGGENLSEAFRARNPFARIPVLELDDGTCLAETMAICRYLEETHPDPLLFGRDPLARAQVEMWNRRVEFHYLLPVAFAFRNLSGYFADREAVVPEWGQAMARSALDALPLFDKRLRESDYLAGEFSVADITLAVALDFAERTRQAPPEGLEGIARWRSQVQARDSFRPAS